MAKWHWYVYVLECQNGRYYTGITWNPPARLQQHKSGRGSRFTGKYGVRKLRYLEEHEDLEVARLREKQIKDYSRKKKQQLWAKRSELLAELEA